MVLVCPSWCKVNCFLPDYACQFGFLPFPPPAFFRFPCLRGGLSAGCAACLCGWPCAHVCQGRCRPFSNLRPFAFRKAVNCKLKGRQLQAKRRPFASRPETRCSARSNYRQADAVDFLVHIECIHVGHAADIVDDCHQARFQVVGVDVVLAAHAADKLARVEA